MTKRTPHSKRHTVKVAAGYFITLAALLGGYFLAQTLYEYWFAEASEHGFPTRTIIIGVAVLGGASLAGWWISRTEEGGHAEAKPWLRPLMWLLIVLAGTGLHWLATVAEHALLEGGGLSPLILGSLGFGLNALSAYFLWRYSRRFSGAEQRIAVWDEHVRPRRVVIAFVSSFNGTLEHKNGVHGWTLTVGGKEHVLPVSSGIAGIEQWEEEQKKQDGRFFWNALPLLRGLRPHLGTLERVHLIASTDILDTAGQVVTRGSARQVASIGAFLWSVLQHETEGKSVGLHYHTPTEGHFADTVPGSQLPFHDVDALYAGILHLLSQEEARGLRPSQIIVDATGGQKTSSIAAALATLNSSLAFQYADTNRSGHVGVFDWTYKSEAQAPHAPGHHH